MALNLLVYYNAETGEAATGGIDQLGNHRFLQRYTDFAISWTQIAATQDRLLYYNAMTNEAATAEIDAAGDHRFLQQFVIADAWTHIAATEDHLLLYNTATGEAAIAVIDTAGTYTLLQHYTDFAQGWTNIAAIQNRLLYYNAATTELATAEIDPVGNHRFINFYPQGVTAHWTSLTSTQNQFLFYNVNEGGGATGSIDELGNYIPLQTHPGLSRSWAQIAGTQQHVLYYSPSLGIGATGEYFPDGQGRDLFAYSDFPVGWTHATALKVETLIAPEETVLNPIVDLIRPDDLLNLNLRLLNMQLDKSDRADPAVISLNPQQSSYLVVTFPPQTIVEQAFFEASRPVPEGVSDPAGIDEPTKKRVARDKTSPTTPPLPPGQAVARMAQPSRLVFRIPADARIPYTTEGLLDWSKLELVVTPIADVEDGATPPDNALFVREPNGVSEDLEIAPETAIELPYRLQISPRRNVVWDHALKAVSHLGRTELWHTRLSSRTTEGKLQRTDEAHPLPLRAIWSPDFPKENLSPGGFGDIGVLTAMTPFDRQSIVILTSAFQGYASSPTSRFVVGQTKPYVPKPIYASQLMLSPLGGWLKSQGAWEPPYLVKLNLNIPRVRISGLFPQVTPQVNNFLSERISIKTAQQLARDRFGMIVPTNISLGQQLDLSQWAHVATQGRDHYVRIVYEGRLKPTGHKAALIKVTERRFEEQPGTKDPVAYLRQFMYIVVREPEKDYRQKDVEEVQATLPAKLRGFLFSRIRLTTLVTPKIDYPYLGEPAITDRSFWVMVAKDYFRFHAIGVDTANQLIDFTIPLIFVPNSEADFVKIENNYSDRTDQTRYERRRKVIVPGQKIAFADPIPEKDNTSFITQDLYFANYGTGNKADFFRPKLFKANVRIPAVEQLLGKDTSTSIKLQNQYVQNGFEDAANATGVFAEIVKEDAAGKLIPAVVGLGFNAEQAGGFATPNMDITNLSRQLGALGGNPANALQDSFDPTQYFESAAKIFGSFALADLIEPGGTKEKNAPKMEIQRDGTAVTATLDWNPTIKNAGIPGALQLIVNGDDKPPKTQLNIHGTFEKNLGAPSQDDFLLTGKLNHFSIFFFDSVQINFSIFSFTAQSGKKKDIEVTLDEKEPIKFIGNLEFVEGLRELIPPGVFGDGVSIDLIESPLGVKASLSLGLPPAAVGVFALQNIAFTAGLTLPFLEGKPIFDFAFARRDNPFMLTVAFFGGGGFFHVEIDTDGLRSLEASFEFGAAASLNVFIASGEVHIMAGIYFGMKKMTQNSKEIQVSLLTGYLRCGGKLSVLGLVSVSIEFYLAFTYLSTGKAYGTAILTITVEIFFFEKTFEIKVERSFGKDGNDPLFKQLMDTSATWGEYAAAFA